jgi:hypothetical protein
MGTHSETFIVPRIFTGNHELTVEHPSCETLSKSIQISATNDLTEMISLTMSESARNELAGRTQDLFNSIIASAIQGHSIEALNIRLTREENHRNGLINYYNWISNALHTPEGESGINNISNAGFVNTNVQTELYSDGVYTVEMNVDFDIEYVYYDWEGEAHLETEPVSTGIIFSYVFENGEWVIQNFFLGF